MSDTKITFDTTITKIGTTSCGCEVYSNAVALCPLHAAAPDLLAAHQRIAGGAYCRCAQLPERGKCPCAARIARAAVAKAKGEEK